MYKDESTTDIVIGKTYSTLYDHRLLLSSRRYHGPLIKNDGQNCFMLLALNLRKKEDFHLVRDDAFHEAETNDD